MAEVHIFPGVERVDLAEVPDDEAVLRGALDQGLRDVTIVARDPEGSLYIASSMADPDRCIGLLHRAIADFTAMEIVVEPFHTDDGYNE